MSDKKMQEKFSGTLLGLAVGDALGGPVEFKSSSEIKKSFNGPLKEMVGGGWLKLKPGEYTDDTAMMLCIAESLVENKDYNPDDIAQRFVGWYKTDPKDIGGTTRRALAKIARGVSWKKAGNKTRPTNGSVMRCAPIGLMFAFNQEKLVETSTESSAITHAHQDSVLSCVLINVMIANLVQAVDKEKALGEARGVVGDIKSSFVRNMHLFRHHAEGSAVHTALVAISSLLRADTFEEAVVHAVNLGGDADTVGAVTGALAGAYWGALAIPERWFSKLNPYTALQVVELGNRLFELATNGNTKS